MVLPMDHGRCLWSFPWTMTDADSFALFSIHRNACPASTVHLSLQPYHPEHSPSHLLGTCKCSTPGCLPALAQGPLPHCIILAVLTLIHPPVLVYTTLLLEAFLDRSCLCVVHSHQPSLPIPPCVTLCIITKKQLSNENICHGPF